MKPWQNSPVRLNQALDGDSAVGVEHLCRRYSAPRGFWKGPFPQERPFFISPLPPLEIQGD